MRAAKPSFLARAAVNGRVQIKIDHRNSQFLCGRDASIGRTGIHINNGGVRLAFDRLQAIDQPLPFVAANDDDTKIIWHASPERRQVVERGAEAHARA